MIVYFDTSAYVPLLIAEASSAAVRELWDLADGVCSSDILRVEASAALGRAARLGRLDERSAPWFARRISEDMERFTLISVDKEIVHAASAAAWTTGLRAYDLVHFATAMALTGDDLVAASGDKELLAAWSDAGLTVIDTAP